MNKVELAKQDAAFFEKEFCIVGTAIEIHETAFVRGYTQANETLSAQIAELRAVNSEQADKIANLKANLAQERDNQKYLLESRDALAAENAELEARREDHLRTIAHWMGKVNEIKELLAKHT